MDSVPNNSEYSKRNRYRGKAFIRVRTSPSLDNVPTGHEDMQSSILGPRINPIGIIQYRWEVGISHK